MQVSPGNFLVIGHLQGVEDVHFDNNGHPYINVSPNSYKFLEPRQTYLNMLSSGHHKIRVYIGSILNDDSFEYSDNNEKDLEKAQEIYWHYQHCVFVIRPSCHVRPKGDVMVTGKSKAVYILDKHHDLTNNDTLTPVPIFSKDNTADNINTKTDFEKALNNRQVIGDITTSPWPTNPKAYPDAIIWKKAKEEYYLYAGLTVQRVKVIRHSDLTFSERVAYGLSDNDAKPLCQLDHKTLYDSNFVYQDGIAFINYDRYIANQDVDQPDLSDVNDITQNCDRFRRQGTSLYSSIGVINLGDNHQNDSNNNHEDSEVNKESKDYNAKILDDIENDSDNEQDALDSNSDTSKPASDNTSSVSHNDENSTETVSADEKNKLNVDFIHKLEHLAYQHNPRLYYRREDLINFHTAMKCNGLVVLAGLSGTGKSALINLYAEALGLSKKQFNFIPVRPFWNDDSDLLGYVDTVHSRYCPAESGLVDTLVQASQHPNRLYMVTFDEMNLARVEYYFSQFLSIMEKDPDDRYIQLYNPDLVTDLTNSNGYPPKIKVGSNVLFTGTINLDESTHKFSDKVLDRSNIINLKLVPYFEDSKAKDVDVDDSVLNHKYTYKDFADMKDCNDSNGLTNEELKMLWQLHTSLNDANGNLGIGRRVINQINQYLRNMPSIPDEPISHGEALDWQLVQRVITKVRGANSDIGEILNPSNDNSDNLTHILKQYSDISDFKESIAELKRKYQEVRDYGFTV